MKSNELLPFSRNRYYKGKMLTSVDFEAEQLYMNNKRRFINQMITGSGIVCGLNVISLDDLSLMIESGMALDDTGREITVDSSVVKKLSAISGFEELQTSEVCLCVRYKESEVQPVYAVSRQDTSREFENNRIEDGYELFLQDTDMLDEEYETESEFYTGGILFENQDYRVSLKLPANICAGHYARLDVEIEKLSDADVTLAYTCSFQTPVLTSLEGTQSLQVDIEGMKLEKGKTAVKEYWMLAQTEEYVDTSIMVKAGSAKALVENVEYPTNTGINYKINIVSVNPEELAARETSRVSMELRGLGGNQGIIKLANIQLVRTDAAYLIEKVDESVRKYIPTTRDTWKRLEYSQYFSRKYPFWENGSGQAGTVTTNNMLSRKLVDAQKMATGIVEIPVGDHARAGDICYSGEVMHGLGEGNIYVEVGYEYLEENEMLGRNAKTTIYGDPDLFEPGTAQVAADTAVKVFNDKGSFIVALKLKQNVNMLVLTYRWVAMKFDSEKIQEEADVNNTQSISAVTPTILLGSKESYFFQVRYNNMKACSISYELTEQGSGEITSDGIYTAPAKEGVYEIRIYCTDKPLICTYAYAIVKKKVVDDAGNDITEKEMNNKSPINLERGIL